MTSSLPVCAQTFKSTFNAKTVAVQGSGWGWLGYNKDTDKLEIATCANQDPLSTKVRVRVSVRVQVPCSLILATHHTSRRTWCLCWVWMSGSIVII